LYGVSADVDLSFLVGATLIQVRLGQFDIQFHFHPKGEVGVQGELEFRDPSGAVLESGTPDLLHSSTMLGCLLGSVISRASACPPRSIVLRFQTGHEIELFDSSPTYECFQISPGGIIV
jgi:hypothetical protein